MKKVIASSLYAICLVLAACDEQNKPATTCTVEQSADGETATISCPDGTTSVVKNGSNGNDGVDGQDGISAVWIDANGTVVGPAVSNFPYYFDSEGYRWYVSDETGEAYADSEFYVTVFWLLPNCQGPLYVRVKDYHDDGTVFRSYLRNDGLPYLYTTDGYETVHYLGAADKTAVFSVPAGTTFYQMRNHYDADLDDYVYGCTSTDDDNKFDGLDVAHFDPLSAPTKVFTPPIKLIIK